MGNPLARLRQVIVERYDLEELRTLCFDLSVDSPALRASASVDALRGEGTAAKTRELLLYLGRRGRLEDLLDAMPESLSEAFEPAEMYATLSEFEAGEGQQERPGRFEATLSGSGAIAQGDRAEAAGEGGVAVGGDVAGGIQVGGLRGG
jgi:hypothetical protein